MVRGIRHSPGLAYLGPTTFAGRCTEVAGHMQGRLVSKFRGGHIPIVVVAPRYNSVLRPRCNLLPSQDGGGLPGECVNAHWFIRLDEAQR